jgi:hypothetical protein
MNRGWLRFYGTLAACFLGGGVIGGLLGWAKHANPTLAAVTRGLVTVGGRSCGGSGGDQASIVLARFHLGQTPLTPHWARK